MFLASFQAQDSLGFRLDWVLVLKSCDQIHLCHKTFLIRVCFPRINTLLVWLASHWRFPSLDFLVFSSPRYCFGLLNLYYSPGPGEHILPSSRRLDFDLKADVGLHISGSIINPLTLGEILVPPINSFSSDRYYPGPGVIDLAQISLTHVSAKLTPSFGDFLAF